MSYTVRNFKSKKELKEAVDKYNLYKENPDLYKIHMINQNISLNEIPEPVRCYQPGLGPDLSHYTGTVYLEGPHYPQPHKWYATAVMENGIVKKVK